MKQTKICLLFKDSSYQVSRKEKDGGKRAVTNDSVISLIFSAKMSWLKYSSSSVSSSSHPRLWNPYTFYNLNKITQLNCNWTAVFWSGKLFMKHFTIYNSRSLVGLKSEKWEFRPFFWTYIYIVLTASQT